MKLRIVAIMLLLGLMLGSGVGLAGSDFTSLEIDLSSSSNGKSVKAVVEPMNRVILQQTGPLRYMMMPSGELIAPLWLEIEPMDVSPTAATSTPVSLEGVTVNLLDVSHLVQRKTLRLLVDLFHVDGMQYRVYIPEAIDQGHTIQVTYDGKGFGSTYSLSVEKPEFAGVRVNDEESRGYHLVLEMEKGVPIPYPSKWTFYASRHDIVKGLVKTQVEIDAVEGWMRKDNHGRYLPPDDPAILAQYPELKNKCILTFTHFNEDGTSCYVTIEGRWPEE